ncbi:MAG: GNAT family N-acetyltransferase [Desulfobacteraceae bacterium]|nr:GNAT family N-acetyltransferase [Desulfobacteraceae bacterium]
MQKKSSIEFKIKIIKSVSKKDLIQLYKEAGWWESSYDNPSDFLDNVVKDSAVFAGAFSGKKIIGMGRALSDMVSDAYIQDVAVLKAYRGKGIGKKIIQLLLEKLKENNVDWIGVIAQPGTTSFYRELGFDILKDHIPLKYKGV